MATTVKQVREVLWPDSTSVSKGVFTVRWGFFYTHGRTTSEFVAHVKAAFPDARVLDSGEVWKPFRGGATTAHSSHWFVKFTVPAAAQE